MFAFFHFPASFISGRDLLHQYADKTCITSLCVCVPVVRWCGHLTCALQTARCVAVKEVRGRMDGNGTTSTINIQLFTSCYHNHFENCEALKPIKNPCIAQVNRLPPGVACLSALFVGGP